MSSNVQTAEKFIVIPYRKNRRNLVAAEMRPTQTAESATRIAGLMAERFAGVVAYAVTVDTETGDMNNPRLLASYGEVPAQQED
ncbi:hypothetical protein ACI0FM_13080 [Paenochrobactrum sp. BZR 588]|uniref:hypothetical protein n=1 Tax=Paenochrobactrum TaxID=999488 RepID=UPI0035BC2CAF